MSLISGPAKRRIFFLIFLGVLILVSPLRAEDDFQTRGLLSLKFIDTKKFDFVLFNQVRTRNDAKDINFYMISPQFKFDLWKNLGLGLNYSYINLKIDNPAAGRSEYKLQHRLELEANPHWDIGGQSPWLKIQTRNRYEFRWIEDQGSDNPRFRHRTNLEFPLKKAGRLQSIYMNSEFFYDINDHRYNENWTVPFGLKFKVNPQVSWSVFYMIQSKLTDTWTSSQVLGTHLMVNF